VHGSRAVLISNVAQSASLSILSFKFQKSGWINFWILIYSRFCIEFYACRVWLLFVSSIRYPALGLSVRGGLSSSETAASSDSPTLATVSSLFQQGNKRRNLTTTTHGITTISTLRTCQVSIKFSSYPNLTLSVSCLRYTTNSISAAYATFNSNLIYIWSSFPSLQTDSPGQPTVFPF
jgi:hypothetical protein